MTQQLPSMQEALGSIPNSTPNRHGGTSDTGKAKAGEGEKTHSVLHSELKVSVGYRKLVQKIKTRWTKNRSNTEGDVTKWKFKVPACPMC